MIQRIMNVSLDCADPYRLAAFWSLVLDVPMDERDAPGDDEVGLAIGEGQELLFLKVPEPKTVKNRMHLCLRPRDSRDADVERYLAAGASLLDDRREPDGKGWVVLADPEGNEFCVLRFVAGHPATP